MKDGRTNSTNLKASIQKLGSNLSGMVMPNIGAFIAWGVITALFIPDGWLPNEEFASMVGPMITYLLPLLIGYTGGNVVYGQRGAVVGAIATMGAIVGTDVPMFIGGMIMGPLGGWVIKKFDELFQDKVRSGLEMLVNNFSSGLLGFALSLIAFKVVGPVVAGLTGAMATGVEAIVRAHLLPLANVLIEPAKILFLNNALNHGIFTPLGADQVEAVGKSVLFLLEANPGPGLGVLLAFLFFGKGSAKASSAGAAFIHFIGGIHEIYFPYVMMKPLMFLAVIAGGVSGTLMFQMLGAGLRGPASPGSIIAILGMTPRGGYVPVLAGVIVSTIVSFVIGALILRMDRSEEDNFEEQVAATQSAKQASKGQSAAPSIERVVFVYGNDKGSTGMGASTLRNKFKRQDVTVPVVYESVDTVSANPTDLYIIHDETFRNVSNLPKEQVISVASFLDEDQYDRVIERLEGVSETTGAAADSSIEVASGDFSGVERIIFACDAGMGSSAMGASLLRKKVKEAGLDLPVTNSAINNLTDDASTLVITQEELTQRAKQKAPSSTHVSVENFLENSQYDRLIEQLKA
ncbi:PTS mannitol transporter subunit IICBA [Dolosicoccus paucivorans]|uniref:PTS mannitol transporter subunit IICBA n=1 Tax=Dolosicoccus paucivorans TaxID=84521 RepID=UPI001FD076F5|nr:PTS mannitol transporter subunit IICBA [Dolosicoccus paucivorans]